MCKQRHRQVRRSRMHIEVDAKLSGRGSSCCPGEHLLFVPWQLLCMPKSSEAFGEATLGGASVRSLKQLRQPQTPESVGISTWGGGVKCGSMAVGGTNHKSRRLVPYCTGHST